jgi:hypothetical protein
MTGIAAPTGNNQKSHQAAEHGLPNIVVNKPPVYPVSVPIFLLKLACCLCRNDIC